MGMKGPRKTCDRCYCEIKTDKCQCLRWCGKCGKMVRKPKPPLTDEMRIFRGGHAQVVHRTCAKAWDKLYGPRDREAKPRAAWGVVRRGKLLPETYATQGSAQDSSGSGDNVVKVELRVIHE